MLKLIGVMGQFSGWIKLTSWLLLLDSVFPEWGRNNGVVWVSHETRILANVELVAGLGEGGLSDRVVLLMEFEVDDIANLGIDVGWGVH